MSKIDFCQLYPQIQIVKNPEYTYAIQQAVNQCTQFKYIY